MTNELTPEVIAAAERLKSHQMFRKDCNHLWNAHRQCQWCHSMQRDVDVGIVAALIAAQQQEAAERDKPIDVEWLLSIGAAKTIEPRRYELVQGAAVACVSHLTLLVGKPWIFDGFDDMRTSIRAPPTTRGELLDLLAALKIQVKGGE